LAASASVLDDTPLQPVVGTSKYDADHEEHVIYEMLSWRPSGLIVAGLEHTDAARAMMANAGIPVVEVMDVDGDPVAAAVGISHESAGRDMAREIVGAAIARSPIWGRPPRPITGRRNASRGFARVWPRRA
jgi:LacI family gluconate utilization system Gnt-I transcriptional repressor